jgi:hypothetical protein
MNLNLEEPAAAEEQTRLLQEKLESATGRLEQASPFAKHNFQTPVLELAGRMLTLPGGLQQLYALAPRLDNAGLFHGTDWAEPGALQPRLVNNTFEQGSKPLIMLECLSELRLLAIINGAHSHEGVSAEQARHFLTQVLALNLNHLFGTSN